MRRFLILGIAFLLSASCFAASLGFVDPNAINSTNWAAAVATQGGTIDNSLNFEAHSLGTVGSVTLSATGTYLFETGAGPDQGNETSLLPGEGIHPSSRYLRFNSSGTLTLSFAMNVLGVGLQTVDLFTDSSVTIAAYDAINASGNLIGSYTRVSGTNLQDNHIFFLGILDTTKSIRSVQFTFTSGGGDQIGVDNIQFATGGAPVPEPATYALFWMGLVAVFLRKRSRRI